MAAGNRSHIDEQSASDNTSLCPYFRVCVVFVDVIKGHKAIINGCSECGQMLYLSISGIDPVYLVGKLGLTKKQVHSAKSDGQPPSLWHLIAVYPMLASHPVISVLHNSLIELFG